MNVPRVQLIRLVSVLITIVVMTPVRAEEAGRTLQSIMQQLSEDLARATQALTREDFGVLENAALAIATHPRPGTVERKRLLAELGFGALRFQGTDRAVKDAALAVAEAAKAGDLRLALQTHQQLLAGCVDCHLQFRDRMSERETE